MSFKTLALAAAAALFTLPAFGDDMKIMIKDAYVRSGAKSGAAFLTILNHSDTDDRLVAAATDAAPRVELHTHIQDDNGVVKMRPLEGGIAVPAGGMHALKRGADHVMMMGLDGALEQGSTISLTLTFEQAGDITIEVPVNNDRKAVGHDGHSGHSD